MGNGVFFGYPQTPPKIAEICRSVAENLPGPYDGVTWESLFAGGKVIIQQVCEAIEESRLCIFDVTYPNENVLFEVGFAIGRAKPVWLVMDSTIASAARSWKQLGLFQQVGYMGYRNVADLLGHIRLQDPMTQLEPLYDSLIEPVLPPGAAQTNLLYCPPFAAFEAANRLTGLVERKMNEGLQVVTADPSESSLNQLTWYSAQLAQAAGVLINLAGADRQNARVHNLRNAVVAGLAVAMEIKLLILAEDDYTAPFDYADLVHVYDTAASCLMAATPWLEDVRPDTIRARKRLERKSPLAGLRFGEHVAENERADLYEYFIDTAAFQEVIAARDSLFVGHRGTGKTANAIQAVEEISRNKANLAVLIKPAGFEFAGLLAAVERLPDFTHDYLFDSLWRFVIHTELAAAVLERLDRRPGYLPPSPAEREFVEYVESLPFDLRVDLSARLDQALTHLTQDAPPEDVTPDSGRVLINEAFHFEALARLRHQLGLVLGDRDRVAVFIDNLDKGWEKRARLDVLARLILGLLSARGRVVADFSKQDWWRQEVRLTVAVFLRTDIYSYLRSAAREPDKLSLSSIKWNDPEVLLRVIEERVESAWHFPGDPPATWGELFEAQIDGEDVRSFIMRKILPRPRDLVYLANSALAKAVDRRHDRVTAQDIKDAVEVYSQYAYEALLVENGVTIPEMEKILFAFLTSKSVVTGGEIDGWLARDGVTEDRYAPILSRLIEMSFLGLETTAGVFEYPEVGSEMSRAEELARRVQPQQDARRYKVHEAFHSFLAIEEN